MPFLIPDGDKWLDPRNGKHVETSGFAPSGERELLEMTDKGFRKHPVPKAVDLRRGAKRGQINGDDYRALIANGVTPEQVYEMNSKYLMEQLGRNP